MADEPQLHDLTKMLLTRLESNPEEFGNGRNNYKWYRAVEVVREHGAKLDKETLNAALRKHYMDEAHVDALKLLMGADGDGVGLRSTKHPTGNVVAGLSGHTPGNAGGGGGSSSVNINTLGQMMSPGTLTQYNAANQTLTPEEALALVQAAPQPLGTPTTMIDSFKRRLGL